MVGKFFLSYEKGASFTEQFFLQIFGVLGDDLIKESACGENNFIVQFLPIRILRLPPYFLAKRS